MNYSNRIRESLQCERAGCECHRPQGLVHCPAHHDTTPSLSVTERDDRLLVKCFGGCSQDAVIAELKRRGLWPERRRTRVSSNGHSLTLAALAEAKKLPLDFLRELGLRDTQHGVKIPYFDQDGQLVAVRYRLALSGERRFYWRKGDKSLPYGLWRLAEARDRGQLFIVEGESDTWTLWLHGVPALGVPGKSVWRREWTHHLDGIESIYLWVEPDAEDFAGRLGRDLPHAQLIFATDSGFKDISDAHVAGADVPAMLERLAASAVPFTEWRARQQARELDALEQQTLPVLTSPDPIQLVREAIAALGYGGDESVPLIVYLACTTRLLKLRPGQLPCHVILLGPPGIGKTFAISVVLRLLPSDAYIATDASSPRAFIYETGDMKHKVLVLAEADSLPAGEDNPAASAVRALLQDGQMTYKLVVREPERGSFTVETIVREGPTVFITSATRKLGDQLMSRLLALEIPASRLQLQATLTTQAVVERYGAAEPAQALIAYQRYLQRCAPFDVVVPFADTLAQYLGAQPNLPPRVTRDFAKLLALIKAATILRHRQRERDEGGRYIATLDDYRLIYELVGESYREALSVGERIRSVVETVATLSRQRSTPVSVSDVARTLNIPAWDASRRVRDAVAAGYLVNNETRPRAPAKLSIGEPLPDEAGLPTPEKLEALMHEGAARWTLVF